MLSRSPIGRCSRRHDDDYTRRYRKFLLQWNRQTESAHWKLFQDDPALYHAHLFNVQRDHEWKYIMEARLLSGETDELIAESFQVMPEVVDYYEKLFFNVRDRLSAKSWIIKTIIGPAFRREPESDGMISSHMQHSALKLFAYFGGPAVLDVMLTGLEEGPIPLNPEKAMKWVDHAFETTIKTRAATAARNMRIDKWNVMQLLEIHQRFIQQTEMSDSAGGAGADYEDNVVAFLETVPLAMGKKASENKPQELLQYEHTAVEPTADQQYALATGHEPQHLLDRKDYQQPEAMEGDNENK